MAGSNTFGGTIKLEGEKQYRAAIQQINSDLKVMASEMVKVTDEFKKNGSQRAASSGRSRRADEQEEIQSRAKCAKRALRQYF